PPPAPRPAAILKETPKESSDNSIISDKATAAFIRRTLCAHHALSGAGEKDRNSPRPVDELLPPLTSSNEVDLQLYAIVAVILKEFVFIWYTKITPDHVFVDEVIQIVAHCTRALEQRLRKVDLESLLLDELPQLIDTHLSAFRIAQDSIYPLPLANTPREVYHTLTPHPALSPVPLNADPSSLLELERNEEAWRQLLVQGVLAVLLPTEDLENGCLRTLVTDIFAEMILGNGLSKKACEPWLLWDAITTIIEATHPRTGAKNVEKVQPPTTASSRLEQFGLLSGANENMNVSHRFNLKAHGSAAFSSVSGLFWTVVQYMFLAFTAGRIVIYTLATSSTMPSRSKTWLSPVEAERQDILFPPKARSNSHTSSASLANNQRPILDMAVWPMMAHLIEINVRMPWLSGMLALLQHGALFGPGRVGDTDGALDRLLSNYVRAHMLNPAYIPKLLRIVRATLFPNNQPGPPRKIPSAIEVVAIKRRCAETIASVLPPPVGARIFALQGVDLDTRAEALVKEIEGLLDILSDSYMNRHLVFGIVELVVVRFLPELGEKGVGELMRDRL
ncbi:hypothetical protein EJ08DRAFT_564489, partial [Tothia fuscella]